MHSSLQLWEAAKQEFYGVETDSNLQNERHSYEKCQYEEFKKRVAKMDELRAEKGGARSN